MKMYSTVILFYRAEPSTGKQRSVVADSPDQPTGPEQQAGRAGQAGQSGTAGQSGEPGRPGQPCRYTTEEEHLVAFLENGREEEEGEMMRKIPEYF